MKSILVFTLVIAGASLGCIGDKEASLRGTGTAERDSPVASEAPSSTPGGESTGTLERDPPTASVGRSATSDVSSAKCVGEPAGKSKSTVGFVFTNNAESLCIWWEPASGASGYRIEASFPAADATALREVDGATTSLVMDLDSVNVPEEQDRELASRVIEISVWAIVDGRDVLVGTVAMQAG